MSDISILKSTLPDTIIKGIITLESYQELDEATDSIVINEAKLPKRKEPTKAELLSELQSILDRAKEIEEQLNAKK